MINQKRTLERATIVGFFSIPSPTLAEHNPSAYAAAMAGLPEGSGSCSHCGMGIRHHVVIRDEDGGERFIGCMCAEKVGVPKAREAIRYRMTTEQLAFRPLSFRQAEYVAKATSATGRRNKRNAEAFDAVIDLCTTA